MYEKLLRNFTRVTSILLITAIFAVFIPQDVMGKIHKMIGLGDFIKFPILEYTARSLSLFYAYFGTILFYISLNIRQNIGILKMICIGGFVFSLCQFYIDSIAGLPKSWIYFEGPFVLALNLFIYYLVFKVQKELAD